MKPQDNETRFYHGFLYGIYDSRGGTIFAEGDTREEADARFLLMWDDGTGKVADEILERKDSILEEDFICAATLESPQKLENNKDLEHRGALVFAQSPNGALDDGEGNFVEFNKPARLVYSLSGENPDPAHLSHSRWDDDAFNFLVLLKS